MIVFRNFEKNDCEKVINLIKSTFLEFNGNEGEKKYVEEYMKKIGELKDKCLSPDFMVNPFFIVSEDGKKIVGALRGSKSRIYNLFVDGNYHNKGIGKKLVEIFENKCRRANSKEVKLRSSLYAIRFYERQGYKKTRGKMLSKGIWIQPMRKMLI